MIPPKSKIQYQIHVFRCFWEIPMLKSYKIKLFSRHRVSNHSKIINLIPARKIHITYPASAPHPQNRAPQQKAPRRKRRRAKSLSKFLILISSSLRWLPELRPILRSERGMEYRKRNPDQSYGRTLRKMDLRRAHHRYLHAELG